MFKERATKIGLGFFAVAALLSTFAGFASGIMGVSLVWAYFYVVLPLGLSGLAFLVASTFLPVGRGSKPNFTQELMGKERLNYGGVYTEGNWMTVLDEKDKDEKKRRRHYA